MVVLCCNLFEIVCFKCKTGAIGASGEQGMNKICCLVLHYITNDSLAHTFNV